MTDGDPWIGRVIDGRYRIDAVIGRGGFGAVYRGTHLGLDREVALKRVKGDDDGDLVTRLGREAKLQARLRHTVCVMVYDFVVDAGDGPWLVQEYIDGIELEAVLRREGALDARRAVRLTCRLLEGLSAAHALDIVHRDIKPANIMLVRDSGREDVRLLDFGIARAMTDEDTCMTSPGMVIGTPRYISPEQARGEPPSPSNDLYAVGIVLYSMLTGGPPFRARAMRDAVVAHLTLDPPPLPPEVPPRIAAVVESALAKDPAARPPSADAMIDRLHAALRAHVDDDVVAASRPRTSGAVGVPVSTLVDGAEVSHRAARDASPAAEPSGVGGWGALDTSPRGAPESPSLSAAPSGGRARRTAAAGLLLTGALGATAWGAFTWGRARGGVDAARRPATLAATTPPGLAASTPRAIEEPRDAALAAPTKQPAVPVEEPSEPVAQPPDAGPSLPAAAPPVNRRSHAPARPKTARAPLTADFDDALDRCDCDRAGALLVALRHRRVDVRRRALAFTSRCATISSTGCRRPADAMAEDLTPQTAARHLEPAGAVGGDAIDSNARSRGRAE